MWLLRALKGQVSPSKGYLVVAVRSDGEVAVWPDMEPDLHEYYDYEVREAVKVETLRG